MKMKMVKVQSLRVSGLVALLLIVGACGSTKPPTDEIARTQAAINQAEQVGARNYAPLELREARKKLDQARQLIDQKQYERARRMADQAEVDAQLAESKTLSEKAQKAVRELKESIRILKEEIIEKKQPEQDGSIK